MYLIHGGGEAELTVASKRTRSALVPSLSNRALVLVSLEVMAFLRLSIMIHNPCIVYVICCDPLKIDISVLNQDYLS